MRFRSAIVLPAVAMFALAACTSGAEPAAQEIGTPAASDGASRELEFVACMRQHGVDDMPDPVPGDTTGRSAVRYAIDVMGKGSDQAFQGALDECLHFLPSTEAVEPRTPDEMAKYLDFAKCVREHGVPDFPDPIEGHDGRPVFQRIRTAPDGAVESLGRADGATIVDLYSDSPKVVEAAKACEGKLPPPTQKAP